MRLFFNIVNNLYLYNVQFVFVQFANDQELKHLTWTGENWKAFELTNLASVLMKAPLTSHQHLTSDNFNNWWFLLMFQLLARHIVICSSWTLINISKYKFYIVICSPCPLKRIQEGLFYFEIWTLINISKYKFYIVIDVHLAAVSRVLSSHFTNNLMTYCLMMELIPRCCWSLNIASSLFIS